LFLLLLLLLLLLRVLVQRSFLAHFSFRQNPVP